MYHNISWQLRFGLLLVLALAVIKFGLLPFHDWQSAKVENILILRQAVARKKALIGNEQKIMDALKQARTVYRETAKLFISGPSDRQKMQLQIQKEIEKLFSDNGIEIKSSKWLPVFNKSGVLKIPLNVRFATMPAKLVRLAAAIENHHHFVSIERLQVRSTANTATVQVAMDIAGYGITPSDR
ncbi:MAG: hypothetical protein BZ151_07475 [Desulfobacca sp. 4484_104]|nr:MAG: hypothetical protein BZ151_07475 [Desulfobacca sp. 4484_104]RLB72166.1 MAG: hypothetical protein DRH04_00070 [Deltaproteobacteria bacterium]